VGAHESQHALASEVQAAVRQPGPYFSIALAMERAGGKDRADRLEDLELARFRGR